MFTPGGSSIQLLSAFYKEHALCSYHPGKKAPEVILLLSLFTDKQLAVLFWERFPGSRWTVMYSVEELGGRVETGTERIKLSWWTNMTAVYALIPPLCPLHNTQNTWTCTVQPAALTALTAPVTQTPVLSAPELSGCVSREREHLKLLTEVRWEPDPDHACVRRLLPDVVLRLRFTVLVLCFSLHASVF